MKTIVKTLLLALLITTSFSCLKNNDPYNRPCTFEECAVVAPQAEIDSIQSFMTNNNITATKHCSGLFFRIETAGTGNTANACSYVGARYKGSILNGNVFETRTAPVGFSLTQVIRGWQIGVPMVKAGGRIVLYIPPTLGYGAHEIRDPQTNNLVIPANSYLTFEIDLDGV